MLLAGGRVEGAIRSVEAIHASLTAVTLHIPLVIAVTGRPSNAPLPVGIASPGPPNTAPSGWAEVSG